MKWSLAWCLLLVLVCGAGCGKEPEKDADDKDKADAKVTVAKDTNEVIKLNAEAIAANHIAVATVQRASAWLTVNCPARLEFNADATAVAHTPMEGRVQEWLVSVGSRVKPGDVLAKIECPQSLGAPLELKALISGEIIERAPALGAWVQPADKLAVITDPTTLWVAVQVREDLVSNILPQAPAMFAAFTGSFLRASATVDADTRTVDFRYVVSNAEHKLRAGMFVTAALATAQVQDALLVPDEAVQTVHEHTVVFVELQTGQYRAIPVELGRTLGDQREVLSGLPAGARVVGAGSFVLKSEALRAELAVEKD